MSALTPALLCSAQTYWYSHGVQRAEFCGDPATVRTRSLDGSVSAFCAGHGFIAVASGAELVVNR